MLSMNLKFSMDNILWSPQVRMMATYLSDFGLNRGDFGKRFSGKNFSLTNAAASILFCLWSSNSLGRFKEIQRQMSLPMMMAFVPGDQLDRLLQRESALR